jgi:hypothetical protein
MSGLAAFLGYKTVQLQSVNFSFHAYSLHLLILNSHSGICSFHQAVKFVAAVILFL